MMPDLSERSRRLLRSLARDVAELVGRLIKRGTSASQIEREVRRLVEEFALEGRLRAGLDSAVAEVVQAATEQARQKYTWVESRTLGVDGLRPLLDIVERTQSGFAEIGGEVDERIVRAVLAGVRTSEGMEKIAGRIAQATGRPGYNAFTIANTALAAIDRLSSVALGAQAGVTRKRYAGPPPERHYCVEHFGKEYDLDVLVTMRNESGRSALVYCGDWNCRHWWEDVLPSRPGAVRAEDVARSMRLLENIEIGV